MNEYRKAMFESYWLPLLLFYLLPNFAVIAVIDKAELFEVIVFILTFPFLVLLSGYILAPIFGPKVQKNGLYAYVMAYICLGFGVMLFGFLYMWPSIRAISIIVMAIIGFFPALIGGTFFLGSCKNKNT